MQGLLELATAAHRGTSFVPEQRGRQHVDEVREHLAGVRAWIADRAPAEMVDELFEEYRAGYEARYRPWLAAMGRTISPMVAGPSRFPTARNAKRLETEHRRLGELVAYTRSARKRIAKAIERAKRPADPAAAERAELERLRNLLETMKGCNAVLRRKGTEAEKVAAIVALGLSEATARRLVTEPDFAGRYGFPSYELTSVRGKIERAEARLRVLETVAAEPVEVGGATIEEDAREDRLRIVFEAKPTEATRERLRQAGFRWSPRAGAWQRQLTDAARRAARAVLEAEAERGTPSEEA